MRNPQTLTPRRISLPLCCILLFTPAGVSAGSATKTGGINSEKECLIECTPPSSLEPRPSFPEMEGVMMELELMRLRRLGPKRMRRMWNLIEAGCGRWERWCVYV